MKLKTLVSDMGYFAIANLIAKIAPFLTIPIITRNFSPEEYGYYEILLGISAILTIIISMSLENYLAREWSIVKSNYLRSNLMSSLLTVIVFASALMGIIIYVVDLIIIEGSNQFGIVSNNILMAYLSGAIVAISGLPLMVLRIERKLISFTTATFFNNFCNLGLIFLLSNNQNLTIHSVITIAVISGFIGLMTALYFTRNYLIPVLNVSILRSGIRYSLPLVPALAVTLINGQLDKYILLYFYNAHIVGEFSVVVKLAAIFSIFVFIFRQAWLPHSFNLIQQENPAIKHYDLILKIYYSIGVFLCLLLMYFSPFLFKLLSPNEYKIELAILPLLLLSSLIYGSASIVNIGTLVSGKTEWNSYAAFVGLVANFLLTVILVPLIGVHGAAWGTLLSSIIMVTILTLRSNMLANVSLHFTPMFVTIAVLLIYRVIL